MVIVRLQGGLGNQLFQYTFGQYLVKRYNLCVKFDPQLNLNIETFTNRKLTISEIGIEIPLANHKEVKSIISMKSSILEYRIRRKIIQKLPFINKSYSVQNSNPHIIDFDLDKENIYYDGYWQHINIVEEMLPFLRKEINIKRKSPEFKINNDLSVSIHIRRGDYVNIKKNTNIFSACEIEYFRSAISYLNSKVKGLHYYIFSDDIEWAKQNFIGDSFSFMEGNSVIEDFFMMSNCKFNIISNSTFSTWAAYLNDFEDKIVVYPKTWYNNEFNNYLDKIVSKQWIGL
ncbi:alpha-1,2-fucosyltransferase [Elizabethkingia ursingii]|uniref:alpha-1,2-fucosyltransferase n=1 Tax=Elizabethkingia ursingii TaxID=1756150 RepID=UPI002013A420|nr:alpha-1,2-fucosyltransferase [Elizabethkingia ursingii]MCL1671845.1 alpha-1,2-fucosyltransferase [Elizabethkingia ursingii]